MHESHETTGPVLLPRRLVHRVLLRGSPESPVAIAAGKDNWGLSECIGALPGVMTTQTMLDDGATVTDHLVDPAYVLRSPCRDPQLLCHIDIEGILLPQLDPLDKAEVVLKGWASRAGDEITLYLPRDFIEMEIAWRIILQTYQFLASQPSKSRARRKAVPELPKFASTAKYWM